MNHSNNNDLVLKEIKIDGSAKSFIYENPKQPNRLWRAVLQMFMRQPNIK